MNSYENTFIHIPGIGPKTEKAIWESGLTSWYLYLEQYKNTKTKTLICSNIIESISALKNNDYNYFFKRLPSNEWWRLTPNMLDKAIYFDIETTGLDRYRDEIVMLTFLYNGEISYFVKGQSLSVYDIRKIFNNSSITVSFNGKSFDIPFVEGKLNISLREKNNVDLLHMAKSCKFKGGLKKIEKDLNINRLLPELEGKHFPGLWADYFKNKDEILYDIMRCYAVEDIIHLPKILCCFYNLKVSQLEKPFQTNLLHHKEVLNPFIDHTLIKNVLNQDCSSLKKLVANWGRYGIHKKFKNEKLENEPNEIYDIPFKFPNAEFAEKCNIDFPVNDIKTIVKIRDGFKCVRCPASIDIEVHHIIPRNRGGPDKINNLITLCRKCHAKQHPYLSHLFIGSLPAERTDYWGRFKHYLKKKLHLIDTYEKYINFFTQGKSAHLREGQKEVIDAIMKGKNILAVRPTGSGKSVIFQIPTLMKDAITIVITPLKALMVDQVYNFREKGIPAIYLNSDIHKQARLNILKLAASGAFKFIYLAPERITKGNTDELTLLKSVKADMVVIDEAHTRDTWSAFRPAYKELRSVCNFFNPKQILGFTATANKEVIAILQSEFGFDCIFYQGFDRPNIFLDVQKVDGEKDEDTFKNKMAFVAQTLSGNPHLKTVIFSPTISMCEKIYDELPTPLRETAAIFHSKISVMDKEQILMEFADKRPGHTNVVIATKAFGMGIDISNIRNIIHFSPTSSVLDYVQETGRAGRDGQTAKSTLLYNEKDKELHLFLLDKTLERLEHELKSESKLGENEVQALISVERSKKEKQLDSMLEYCVASGKECLRNFLQRYFRIESNSLQYKKNYSITIRILRWLWLNLLLSDKPTSKEFAINSCCCFCNPEYSHALSRKAH